MLEPLNEDTIDHANFSLLVSLSSRHHEAFELMSVDIDILSELNNDITIDRVAVMTLSLKKLLIR